MPRKPRKRPKAEKATRETLGIFTTALGILAIFVGPYWGYLDVIQSLGNFGAESSIEAGYFYIRWFLLLIIGVILRAKMIDMIHIMATRRIIVYIGLVLGLVLFGTLLLGLLREIRLEALIAYVPFVVNGAVLMSWTKDLPRYA